MKKIDGVLFVLLGLGFPWADVAEEGVRVVVTTDEQPNIGRELVEQLANSLWKIRDEITPQFLEMDAA
jgi:microcystin degradation protein MlrC